MASDKQLKHLQGCTTRKQFFREGYVCINHLTTQWPLTPGWYCRHYHLNGNGSSCLWSRIMTYGQHLTFIRSVNTIMWIYQMSCHDYLRIGRLGRGESRTGDSQRRIVRYASGRIQNNGCSSIILVLVMRWSSTVYLLSNLTHPGPITEVAVWQNFIEVFFQR